MVGILRPALVTVALFTALLGFAAPLAMTGIAGALMSARAGGSLIERDGRVVGSALIGQNFAEASYFHGRTSNAGADGYDATASAATQLGPTSAKLVEGVRKRVAEAGPVPVPADAVTASGSGLDPHVTPANAERQVARVAKAQGMPAERVRALVAANTEARELGILGEPRVNVLRLNLALDALR